MGKVSRLIFYETEPKQFLHLDQQQVRHNTHLLSMKIYITDFS
jgi:hypothetical protein